MPRTRILALDLAIVGAAAWTVGELGRVDTMHFDLRERACISKAKQSALAPAYVDERAAGQDCRSKLAAVRRTLRGRPVR